MRNGDEFGGGPDKGLRLPESVKRTQGGHVPEWPQVRC